jgi:hypothetical protein
MIYFFGSKNKGGGQINDSFVIKITRYNKKIIKNSAYLSGIFLIFVIFLSFYSFIEAL